MERYINWQNFSRRDEQIRIVTELVKGPHKTENTLVVAGTAAGKTGLKLLLIDYLLKLRGADIQIPIIVPKQVIGAQHTAFLRKCLLMSESQIVRIDGSIAPKKREQLYRGALVPITTAECLINDIVLGRCDIRKIGVVLFDEVHNGLGDHDIVKLAGLFRQRGARIIGFTASDGPSLGKIERHLRDLGITHHIISERPKQVTELRHLIARTPEVQKCLDHTEPIVFDSLNYLLNRKLIEKSNQYSHAEISRAIGSIRAALNGGQRHSNLFQGLKHLSVLGKMLYLQELILTGTFHDARAYVEQLWKEDTKAAGTIVKHPSGEALTRYLRGLSPYGIWHPKLHMLYALLNKYPANELKLIFVNDHRTAHSLERFIFETLNMQATTVLGAQYMKFKEAKRRLNEFANGRMNILIATSVLEEGIHIPDIDRVIHYQIGNRAISLTQRNGRTGRTSAGTVEYLLMDESVEITRYLKGKRAAQNQRTNIERALANINDPRKESALGQRAQLELRYYESPIIPIVRPNLRRKPRYAKKNKAENQHSQLSFKGF